MGSTSIQSAPEIKTVDTIENIEKMKIATSMMKLTGKVHSSLIPAFLKAGQIYSIDPVLLVVLCYTESTFDPNAVSKKNYKGLMQTPHKTGYTDIDIMYGARILKEKMDVANGDKIKALALYKGGLNNEAFKQATKTYDIYRKVKNSII